MRPYGCNPDKTQVVNMQKAEIATTPMGAPAVRLDFRFQIEDFRLKNVEIATLPPGEMTSPLRLQ